ncbi:hypothetical protein BDC45DRAFT_448221 [Circinella umbellata]|nr:hypothetical protein BDC45DRAFT_448221 [Circinella umbellata]
MICDTNWCTYCDIAINPHSNSLYCSSECLKKDTIFYHHKVSRFSFPRCRKSMVFRSSSRRFGITQQQQATVSSFS